MYEFIVKEGMSQFDDYVERDLDRVQTDAGNINAKTFQWSEATGGLELGFESMIETYYAAPIQRKPLGQNETGHINKAKFVIGDKGFVLTKDILADSSLLKGAKVIIRRSAVDLDLTDSASFRLIFRGHINTASASSSKGGITIEITERAHDWSRPLAKRKYSKVCGFKFKEPNSCKYVGAETFCDKTLTQCEAFSNEANFGGFPELTDLQFRGL